MALFATTVVTFLFLASLCFLALLARYDLTPKVALYKILKRLGKPVPNLQPAMPEAPYRRIRQSANRHYGPILLNMETSDGSGQACHPDVAFITGGFGAGTWTYWMACTPYPCGSDRYENPELFVSHDGVSWAVPDGVVNPLVPAPAAPGDHNSDPDILFCNGELWLFYRQTLRSKIPNENRIYAMKTPDGLHWSSPVGVLFDNGGRELLSPSVVYDGTQFWMWTVEIVSGEFRIVRRCSQNGLNWTAPLAGIVTGLQAPRHVWHLDVLQEGSRLSAMIVSCIGMGGAESRLHYGYSEDNGISWAVGDFLFDQTYEFESDIQYRASLHKRKEEPPQYDLWYSARNKQRMSSIAYVRLVREQNRLRPILASSSSMNVSQCQAAGDGPPALKLGSVASQLESIHRLL